MLPSGSWLHIAVGFAFGIASTIFAIAVKRFLKMNGTTQRLIGALVLFSLSVALISYVYGLALSGGLLEDWQLLGRPAIGDPAVKVVDIGYVETQSGNIYRFTCLDCQEGNWELVNEITRDKRVFFIESPGNCETLPFLPFPYTDFIDSKSSCISNLFSVIKVVYAVDKDGSVYSWRHSSGGGDVGPRWEMENVFFVIGSILSCGVGVIIILLVMFSNFVVRKRTRRFVEQQSKIDSEIKSA